LARGKSQVSHPKKRKRSILLPMALILPRESGLISILVDEHSGSIDALGAKGDFFLD
jgi:hypothetical protein